MKTFASALLFTVAVLGKDLPDDFEPILNDSDDIIFWNEIRAYNDYSRNAWLGVFQGLYGMGGHVDRPTEECFGTWIPEKMENLYNFAHVVQADAMNIDMDIAAGASYDAVDLMFLNDKYCHFRVTMKDLYQYCAETDSCTMDIMMENLQKNAFNIITQVSTAASIFMEQPWEEMDTDGRSYALNQMGHSMSSLYADLIGFNASKVHRK